MRAHLLRKNYSRNFSSIRSAPVKCGINQGGAVGDHMCLNIGGHVYLMFRKSFKRMFNGVSNLQGH